MYLVLVPFDIGVVYINIINLKEGVFSFSPLRYWGGLYQLVNYLLDGIMSFSPLRYWGGLYQYRYE